MIRVLFRRAVPPTGKAQAGMASFKQETGLIGSLFEKKKIVLYLDRRKHTGLLAKKRKHNLFCPMYFCNSPLSFPPSTS